MNTRGYGIFLYNIGRENEARKCFEEALLLKLEEIDVNTALKIDSYLMIAQLEKDHGYKEKSEEKLITALELLQKVKNKFRKDELNERVRKLLPN